MFLFKAGKLFFHRLAAAAAHDIAQKKYLHFLRSFKFTDMLEVSNFSARFTYFRKVNFRGNHGRVFAGLGHNFSPWGDNQAMAVGRTAAGMLAALRSRQDKAPGFNGPGS